MERQYNARERSAHRGSGSSASPLRVPSNPSPGERPQPLDPAGGDPSRLAEAEVGSETAGEEPLTGHSTWFWTEPLLAGTRPPGFPA